MRVTTNDGEVITVCPERTGTAANHCWHDSGRTLTSYPGYAVEHCCFCGKERHRSLAPLMPDATGHGPHIGGLGATITLLRASSPENG